MAGVKLKMLMLMISRSISLCPQSLRKHTGLPLSQALASGPSGPKVRVLSKMPSVFITSFTVHLPTTGALPRTEAEFLEEAKALQSLIDPDVFSRCRARWQDGWLLDGLTGL